MSDENPKFDGKQNGQPLLQQVGRALVINNNLFSTMPQFSTTNREPLGKRGFDIKRGIVCKLIRQFVINGTSFV